MSGSDTIEFIRRGIQRAPLVTLSLSLTLLSFSVVLYSSPDSVQLTQQVMERWGNTYLRVAQGELWRLFTYAFIHATPSHLAFNLVGILIIGTRVERLIGHLGLLSLFLGAASLGGLLSFLWRDYELSIGASGALYGLLGAELIFLIGLKRAANVLTERRLNRGFLLSALWLLLGLFLGLLNELNSEASAVDTATHLASFSCGALLGAALLWVRSYRASMRSLKGVLVAGSPLLVSLFCIGVVSVLRPTTPGFGGFVSQLTPQELVWRQRQRELSRLSPAEQRALWATELLPPLTEMSLKLDELIDQRLSRATPSHQLVYAQILSEYLRRWLQGARALSQDPLDPFAPQLAQLRMELDLARGKAALILAEGYRELLTLFREPELLQSRLRLDGEAPRLGVEALSLSSVLSLKQGAGQRARLEELDLLGWVALIQQLRPQRASERLRAGQALEACLLSQAQRPKEGAQQGARTSELMGTSLDLQEPRLLCKPAKPAHIVYASLTLYELTAGADGSVRARWLRLSLDLLMTLLSEPPFKRADWRSPPTRLQLSDTLQVAQDIRQLYTLWSQLSAQSFYDLLIEGVAEPLEELYSRWRIVRGEGAWLEGSWWGSSSMTTSLTWHEPSYLHDGELLRISALPPGPEGVIFGVYQEPSGQHWLIEVPLPARLTMGPILIPAACDEACSSLTPSLFHRGLSYSYDPLEPEMAMRQPSEGRWVGLYHISARELSALPSRGMLEGSRAETEERGGWRAWPVGVSYSSLFE